MYYHGTKKKFQKFQTPTGKSGWDVTKGEVVYLTTDLKVAKKYAGKTGVVAVVEAAKAREYKQIRKEQGLPDKLSKYVRNIFVCPVEAAEILEWIS